MSKSRIGNNVFFPMPVTLVGTMVQGRANFMTVAWVSRVNAQPPEVGIGINKTHTTTQGILANKTFSVCFPNRELLVKTDYCGITSGKSVDKSNLFTVFYGDIPSAPMIEECPLCLECELTETVEGKSNYFFIGEIKGAFVDDTCAPEGTIDPVLADYLLLTMPDKHYWSMGEKLGEAWKEGKKYQPKGI
jgi:flavin reductase (DIM6/NTAB) family NADH-FMN oxidoreductase RutF